MRNAKRQYYGVWIISTLPVNVCDIFMIGTANWSLANIFIFWNVQWSLLVAIFILSIFNVVEIIEPVPISVVFVVLTGRFVAFVDIVALVHYVSVNHDFVVVPNVTLIQIITLIVV